MNHPGTDNWKNLILEDEKELLDCVICSAENKLVVHYLRHARSVLFIHDLESGLFYKLKTRGVLKGEGRGGEGSLEPA